MHKYLQNGILNLAKTDSLSKAKAVIQLKIQWNSDSVKVTSNDTNDCLDYSALSSNLLLWAHFLEKAGLFYLVTLRSDRIVPNKIVGM